MQQPAHRAAARGLGGGWASWKSPWKAQRSLAGPKAMMMPAAFRLGGPCTHTHTSGWLVSAPCAGRPAVCVACSLGLPDLLASWRVEGVEQRPLGREERASPGGPRRGSSTGRGHWRFRPAMSAPTSPPFRSAGPGSWSLRAKWGSLRGRGGLRQAGRLGHGWDGVAQVTTDWSVPGKIGQETLGPSKLPRQRGDGRTGHGHPSIQVGAGIRGLLPTRAISISAPRAYVRVQVAAGRRRRQAARLSRLAAAALFFGGASTCCWPCAGARGWRSRHAWAGG